MADNVEATKPADGSPADENGMTEDQSFMYWLIMLPFLVAAGVFIYNFSHHPGQFNDLINAIGAVILGIIVASCANALAGNKGEAQPQAAAQTPSASTPATPPPAPSEAPKS